MKSTCVDVGAFFVTLKRIQQSVQLEMYRFVLRKSGILPDYGMTLRNMKPKLLLIALLSPVLLFGQKELTETQVLEDFATLKGVLTEGHPSLYAYTPKASWDSLFADFEQKQVKNIRTVEELFRSFAAMTDFARDGHLLAIRPELDTVPHMFPLLLKIIEGKLYTDTDDFGIPVGTEVQSINGIGSAELIQRLRKYAPSDGNVTTKKDRQVEYGFAILHFYEFGAKSSYRIVGKLPEGRVLAKTIEPQSLASISRRFPNRQSYFSSYHKREDKIAFTSRMLGKMSPFVYFLDSVSTAVLTVNSFALDPKEFKSKLVELFKEIRKRSPKNLIIDVRQNAGGYRINAVHLYSFLTTEPFRQRIRESTITDQLPFEENVVHTMSDYGEFFAKYFAGAVAQHGRWTITEDQLQTALVPHKKPYKGKVYVLIGGNTFSAASAFALSAKNSEDIVLVGEETGGGYYFHTGQFPVVYELPNSGIKIRMSFVKVEKFVLDQSVPKGSGVLPDEEVSLTVEDLIAGRDGQLDHVLQQLGRR